MSFRSAIAGMVLLGLVGLAASPALGEVPKPFAIEVVDAAIGRGVPLVELETTGYQKFVSDSAGLVAVIEPELMDQEVYFHVRSHGYEFPQDGFGFRGKALRVTPGGSARLELKRINIAERLYRATGAGIYRDSVLLDRETPIRHPLMNGQVVGCDSVMSVAYRDKLFWFWGDTSRPSYPLGNFHMTGATTRLPQQGGLDISQGMNYEYFTDKGGFVRPMAQMPGEGPTWLGGLTVLRDADGRERMYAGYEKVRGLEPYEHGLVIWNDDQQRFDKVTTFEERLPIYPTSQGHTSQRTDNDGVNYVYFSNPFPLTRVPANAEALADPRRFEGFTCLKAGTGFGDRQLDRDAQGRLRYGWKANTPALDQRQQAVLVRESRLKPDEALIALRDVDSGREVVAHRGSVNFNEHRQRWILIATEIGGESSHLGEVWYVEADRPLGPWVYARKIVTHDKYSFYNPKHHAWADLDSGRVVFFEGTYSNSFSGNPRQTPRYDYNQIMYQLDLGDPRLNLPVAIHNEGGAESFAQRKPGRPIAFFALDRPGANTVAVYVHRQKESAWLEVGQPTPGADAAIPVFHAIAYQDHPPPTLTPLYEFVSESRRRAYSIDPAWSRPGYRRTDQPICLVWKNPTKVFDALRND